MATRAFIGLEKSDGTIAAIYCHSDGSIYGGVGQRLFENYQDVSKIEALIAGGDISALHSRVDAPDGHSWDNRINDCTVFYHRDRGEPFEEVKPKLCINRKKFLTSADGCDAAYAYLYAGGCWLVDENMSENFRPLSDCFQRTA